MFSLFSHMIGANNLVHYCSMEVFVCLHIYCPIIIIIQTYVKVLNF